MDPSLRRRSTATGENESLTSTAASAAAAGVGQVDANAPAVELLLVEVGDGGVRLSTGAVGDETEAAGTASVAITHHDGLLDANGTRNQSQAGRNEERAAMDPICIAKRDDTHVENLTIAGERLETHVQQKRTDETSTTGARRDEKTNSAEALVRGVPAQIAERDTHQFPKRRGRWGRGDWLEQRLTRRRLLQT